MADVADLYGVLGVSREASADEIRRAYRKLARELHPDVNQDPTAAERFKQVAAAYEVLSDPTKRQQYDMFGSGAAPDLFPFGDIFDVFFGGGVGERRRGSRRRSRIQRGEDLFVQITLGFEEAAFGAEKDVPLETREECQRCHGSGCEPGTFPSRCRRCGGAGEIQDVARSVFGTVMTARPCTVCEGTGEEIGAPCRECSGQGRKPKQRTVSIEVPAGVSDGMELRVQGAGQDGRQGGGSGDLYVSLRVQPHAIFDRRGQDLLCALPLPMTLAALGTEVEVPTLDGIEQVRIEPGTPSGAVIRLRGKGIPHLGRRGRGDLFVTVLVETPKPRSKEERALLERLAESRGEAGENGKGPAVKVRKLLDT